MIHQARSHGVPWLLVQQSNRAENFKFRKQAVTVCIVDRPGIKRGRQKGTVEGRRMWEGMSDWRGRNDSCLRYCYQSFQVLVYLC